MINKLKLKGNSLIVYALIYTLRKEGVNTVDLSFKEISERVNCTKRSAIMTIAKLEIKGLIKSSKASDNIKPNKYILNTDFIKNT